MTDLLALLNGLEPTDKAPILRAPFVYPGGKSRIADKIIDLLPYTGRYVEVFGGSGAVLLGRRLSSFEVYNDRYGGVVAFYRCLRDATKLDALIERLDLTVHAREEWQWCHDTWDCDWLDDVERAARWYYMVLYSFSGKGVAFGRATNSKTTLSGRARDKLINFPAIHQRLRYVQVENRDWLDCILDYDHPETVFYLDPPYLETDGGIYKEKFTKEDHIQLLDLVHTTLKGFVAVSSYDNKLYNRYPWDSVHSWDVRVSMTAQGTETHRHVERGTRTEVLYIKEAKNG